jgi:ABC-type Fe3+/spermidine/putrescine transport system ATPase subunit
MISVREVSASVGSFSLDRVSFDVPAGQWCAVVGAAGSGKTTLLECIAGLVVPHSGTIALDAIDVTGRPPESRGTSIVYQHGYLFPHLDVGANVSYGAPDGDSVHSLGKALGIDELWGRDVTTLSGGERQLVALARALARRSRYLLLDEPFAALDFAMRHVIAGVTKEIAREHGATVILVTHDLEEARSLADVAVHLQGGRVAASGSARDLIGRLLETHTRD